jgi:hypothetical protein
MSAPTVHCPNCFAQVVASNSGGAAMTCPSCERTFVLTAVPLAPTPKKPPLPVARAIPVPPNAGAAPTPIATPARPVGVPVTKLPEPAGNAPPPPRSRHRDDQEDETPRTRSRRRRDKDDDDDDAPKKMRPGISPVRIVGGVLAAVVVLGGGTAAAVLLLNPPTRQAQATAPATAPATEPAKPRGKLNDSGDFLMPKEPDAKRPGGDFNPEPGGGQPPVGPKWPRPNPPAVDPRVPNPNDPKPIGPKPVVDETEVKLPGTVADTCVGGGGRYFILHLSGKKQLVVFDVTQAKVVKFIPITSDTVKFTAGRDKLVVAYPDDNVLACFDLTTFEKEVSAKSPVAGTLRHVCMGSGSSGPLLVTASDGQPHTGARYTFLDPLTFKPAGIEVPTDTQFGVPGTDNNSHFRANPDGNLFTAWVSSYSPNDTCAISVRGNKMAVKRMGDTLGYLLPGADNRVYSGNGLFTSELKRLSKQPGADQWGRAAYLPAVEGNLYLHVSSQGENGIPGGLGGVHMNDARMKADVRMDGDDRSLFTFKDLGPFGTDAWATHDFTSDKRILFHPSARLLVSVPLTNDRLLLRKFDLEAAFDASGVDYLYVTSRAPAAVAGKAFEYQIAVRSKKGGVKYRLDAGPTGLKVSDTGKVTWTAPQPFTGREQVIVTISDASKQEVFHTFEVVPGEVKAAGPRLDDPVKPAPVTPTQSPAPAAGPVATRPFELKPSVVNDKAVVTLPAAADAVCAGGCGRFFICRLPTVNQLAILDVVEGKVAKYLKLPAADALFAAGVTKLYVLNPTTGTLERFDLASFEKEVSVKNPLGGTPTIMCMGHSTDGPLYVGGPGVGTGTRGYGFLNTQTLKEHEISLDWAPGQKGGKVPEPSASMWDPGRREWTLVHMSGDGRTLVWSNSNGSTYRMAIDERSGRVYQGARGDEYYALRPGPSGHLFGPDGVYNLDLKRPGKHARGPWGASAPATSGHWYVRYIERIHNNEKPVKKVIIGHATCDAIELPLADVGGIPQAVDYHDELISFASGRLALGGRMHLVPEAEILAVLDEPKEKIHLHRVSVKGLLEKSEHDYLLLAGTPRPAARGAKWAYTPEVWSKQGKAVVKLESGPDGMTLNGGTVTWEVPKAFAGPNPTVILSVSDASGQQDYQTFTLSVPDALPSDPLKGDVKPVPQPRKPVADPNDKTLAAAADYACLAGGGRYILLRMPSKKELAVFDTSSREVVKMLPLDEAESLVTGGRGVVVAVNPKGGTVQRWNLTTFEKDTPTKLPNGFTPQIAVMGHASDGPLYLGGGKGPNLTVGKTDNNGFYDPTTLAKLSYKSDPAQPFEMPDEAWPSTLHCSPDGRVWAWWRMTSSTSGMTTLILDGGTGQAARSHVSAGAILVGTDGSLFTGGGVFAADHSAVIDAHDKEVKTEKMPGRVGGGISPAPNKADFISIGRTALPAADSPFYLWFPPSPKRFEHPDEAEPEVKLLGNTESIGQLKGLRGIAEEKVDPGAPRPKPGEPRREPAPFYQRTFFLPSANLLAVLSPDGTTLHVHDVKVRDMLNKSGRDELVVFGGPVPPAEKGKGWNYSINAWSRGQPRVALISGPPGLRVVGGQVFWKVPADLATPPKVEVKFTSGTKSVIHTFTIPLADTAAPKGDVKPAEPPRPPAEPKPVAPKPPEGNGVKAAPFAIAWESDTPTEWVTEIWPHPESRFSY